MNLTVLLFMVRKCGLRMDAERWVEHPEPKTSKIKKQNKGARFICWAAR